jgi:hypothetical protein
VPGEKYTITKCSVDIYIEFLDITVSWLLFVLESARLSLCEIITCNGQPEEESFVSAQRF